MNAKKLVQVNRAQFVSIDGTFRLDFMGYRGGKSEWIISRQNDTDSYFSAIDHAATFDAARARYFELVAA